MIITSVDRYFILGDRSSERRKGDRVGVRNWLSEQNLGWDALVI
ncbi:MULTISPECIES: hypothetical protein [unclassified Microcoleus]|nr:MULTISPECIES: hypothetical protein [unclassified Microcoleus]